MNAALQPLAEPAPAKLNLCLHVTGQRADGYHLIESLAVFTVLGDRVLLSPAEADRLTVRGPFAPDLPADGTNLAVRALAAMRAAFPGRAAEPVSIVIEKNLPVASGMGGGSSDAAATMRLLARHWRLEDLEPLAELAGRLGADVPMCLAARPLLARGIGERLDPAVGVPHLHLVVANPRIAVSTPEVFRRLAGKNNPPPPPLPSYPTAEQLLQWLQETRNDLQPVAAALAPAIADVLHELDAAGATLSRMSGSGATCFGLFADPDSAERAALRICAARPGWFVRATATLEEELGIG